MKKEKKKKKKKKEKKKEKNKEKRKEKCNEVKLMPTLNKISSVSNFFSISRQFSFLSNNTKE